MRFVPGSSSMNRQASAPLFAAFLLICPGCSTYRSKPIDGASVDRALNPPSMDSVRVAAARIKHPLLAPIVIDGRGGYTPDEIAVMVVVVSPELRALRDQRGVAQAQIVQAGILPNPQLGYSVDRPHGTYDPAVVSGRSLGLSWEVTSLLTHHDQLGSARAGAKAVDLSVAWEEWQAAQDARLRAFRILSLERRLPLAKSIEVSMEDTLALTKKAVALGLKTTADMTVAAEAWSQAQNARFDLEQQFVAERAALNLGLGMAPADRVPLKYPVPDSSLALGLVPEADYLLQGLEERRLDLIALRYGYESEEASLRAAVIAQFPKIGLSVNKANDTTPIYTRGLGVTVDLPIFDRNQGQIAMGHATRQQLFDEYVARVAEARSQVEKVIENLATARAQLATVEASLPDLATLVSSYETALASRNSDELAYRDARAALATRQMERDVLQQQVLELVVALEISTGRTSIERNFARGSL
jgi:outer membrane protein TolC